MSIATQEQRQILDDYSRSQRRAAARWRLHLKNAQNAAPNLKAAITVVAYLLIFAVCFQASKTDFSSKSSSYLTEANGGILTTQEGFSATRPTPSTSPKTEVKPVEESASSVPILPATDEPSEDKPSQAQQYTATGYAYGQCTAYVSHRRPIPQNWGNARDWVTRAKAAGFTTGQYARPGAIAQTTAGRYGHVAYVEQVQEGRVYVSEMNYIGWNRKSYRWANESEFTYIY